MDSSGLVICTYANDGDEVDITNKFSSEELPGNLRKLVLRGRAAGPWDSLLQSGGIIIVRTPTDKLTSVSKISIVCNARNVEIYDKGEYLGLSRGAIERDVMFVHNMEDHLPGDGVVTSEISLKFLSLRPIKSGPVLMDIFTVVVGPLQQAPSPPEPMPGSNSMAMLMMMMGAAKGNTGQSDTHLPPGNSVRRPFARGGESPPIADLKKEEGKVEALPDLQDFAGLIMGQVSALLDQKLLPIVSKLDKVEETLARLEQQIAHGQEKNSNAEEEIVVVTSTKQGIEKGLESDLLALREAVRSNKMVL
jgi:hypothetical protein